jgi:hypothetical protein
MLREYTDIWRPILHPPGGLPVRPHFGRVLVDEPDLFTTERLMDGAKAGLGTFWRQ